MYSSTSKFVDGGNKKKYYYSAHRVSNEKLSENDALKCMSAQICYVRTELFSPVAIFIYGGNRRLFIYQKLFIVVLRSIHRLSDSSV